MLKQSSIKILGISSFFHDSSASLIEDGNIIAAVQEERFTRVKNDSSFPINSIRYCLSYANNSLENIDYIVYYEDSKIKFNRIVENFLRFAPRGNNIFSRVILDWISKKRSINNLIAKILSLEFSMSIDNIPKIYNIKHHRSHAASAFYPSPYNEAMILCTDGVGEWETTTIWRGFSNNLFQKKSILFPDSLGLLYSAFTYYLGFKVNSGEYKLMGLAPYGEAKYKNLILDNLINIKDDGSFKLNMDYFSFQYANTMIKSKFEILFGLTRLNPGDAPTQKHMDIAKSIQAALEYILIKIVTQMYKDMECYNLCLSGGVALNCVANAKILENTKVKNIWVQPASGDSGSSIGASLSFWHEFLNNKRLDDKQDKMKFAYLGPSYDKKSIKTILNNYKANFKEYKEEELCKKVADFISKGKVVGWFRGRMEFGPRALGNRSILADPRSELMQSKLNLKIKKRESFRPFAPIVKLDKVSEWFDTNIESPYMSFVKEINKDKRHNNVKSKKLDIKRSQISSVTHVDYTARLQTVSSKQNPILYSLLNEFDKLTGCPVLINTSFNERGEPIVCTPNDAYECFLRTGMDILVIDNYILFKEDQIVTKDIIEKKFLPD